MEILDQEQTHRGHLQKEAPISVGKWLLAMFLTAIPIIRFIMLFVWAFGNTSERSLSNWAKAKLLWVILALAIGSIIVIAFWGVIAAALFAGKLA